jgi:CDP-glucose 4,6-dehydratase
MGGYDPYSASKGCTELAVNAYRRSFFHENGAAIATARAGNVIGGGDWAADRIVPDIIRAVSTGKTVAVRNPNAVRPWQHISEPLHGYLTLAERLYTKGNEYAEAWNFGPDAEGARSVSWLADYVCRKWGEGASWHHDPGSHPHEANYLKLDCGKARARLGWRPQLTVTTALDWTVEWYRESLDGADAKGITEQQINRYQVLGADE